MQLPVDLNALIDEITDINNARETEISISVYVDEKAPADVAAHVRGILASPSSKVRMTLSYLDNSFAPHAGDDMAVIVAGPSSRVGAAAAAVRAAGVPVAIVTTLPELVSSKAQENGFPIPEGDLIAPSPVADEPEPLALDDDGKAAVDERFGEWVVSICGEKHLAFALAFPFLRRPMAVDAVRATSLQNAAVGLLPIFPGADLPIMTLNQAKMVLQIAAAYGQEMGKDRLKELAAVLGGAYLCRMVARELVEFVPVLGFLVRTGIAYGGTAAIGHAVVDYFEGGQDAAGIANVATQATKTADRVATALRNDPEGVVRDVASKVASKIPVVRDRVSTYAPVVRDLAEEYIPKARDAVSEYAPVMRQAVADAVSPNGSTAQAAS